ncbi:ABC transporter ATP-binding protein [Bradyrhizobium diazoefficiens]|nr:ABC transporter ATP-binding protein [Bradyrhizobium diazoefficiens]
MPSIVVDNLTIDIPVLSSRARSLRSVAVAKARAIGGKIVDSGTNISVVRALDQVSFTLGRGDRLGLVGPNGAGKSTLLRVLADIYAPSAGKVERQGTLIPMFDIGIGFDHEATGYENIMLRGMMMGLTRREIAARTDEIAAFSELGEYLDLPIRTYSAGMTLRLMFSIATSVAGDIILMDEWISVGDESFQGKAQKRMLDITGKAGILVVASHNPNTLLQHCNLGMRLEKGRVVDFGPIEKVLNRSSVDAAE